VRFVWQMKLVVSVAKDGLSLNKHEITDPKNMFEFPPIPLKFESLKAVKAREERERERGLDRANSSSFTGRSSSAVSAQSSFGSQTSETETELIECSDTERTEPGMGGRSKAPLMRRASAPSTLTRAQRQVMQRIKEGEQQQEPPTLTSEEKAVREGAGAARGAVPSASRLARRPSVAESARGKAARTKPRRSSIQ
jgi:hypothetical protein